MLIMDITKPLVIDPLQRKVDVSEIPNVLGEGIFWICMNIDHQAIEELYS